MTNEEAKSWLIELAEHEGEEIQIYEEDAEALKIAVEVLSSEPCEDAISRQAVLDCQHFIYDETGEELEVIHAESVLNLPSVTPKIGRWITRPHVYGVTYCSECDFELKIDNTNYCPNCGTKMEVVKE